MRNHSGADEASNNSGDPTLKEREGQGRPGNRANLTEGAPFDVAADHDQPGGHRSPSARGRGEVASDTAEATSDDA